LPVRSPLLRQSLLLSFPGGNEMFQFPPFATYAYGFSVRLFGNPGIDARLTAPPGLSQFSTPFIAFWRQDIPHTPLVAWPHCSRPPGRVAAIDRSGIMLPALTRWRLNHRVNNVRSSSGSRFHSSNQFGSATLRLHQPSRCFPSCWDATHSP
jgi:hypothetical protein